MNFVLHPWQLLLVILAGWLNREQQAVVEYLRTENQILKEIHGKKRILLNDDQRRRLAVKGCWGARRYSTSQPSSLPIRSCAGTENWSPPSGTTAAAARGDQDGRRSLKK